jgi:steroid delta-isomerase-like uncharacterized protein
MHMRNVAVLVLASGALAGCGASQHGGDVAAQLEARKTATAVFADVWSGGRFDRVPDLYSTDVVDDSVGGGSGLEVYRSAIAEWRTAFPDLRVEIEDLTGDGDRVAVAWTASGTQTGPLGALPPTAKRACIRGVTLFRFREGKIVHETTGFDRLDMLRQLGVASR